jgi:short-subunit dehydrogenase
MKKYDFKDKKVLITGASTGIGRSLSMEFARKGAHLILSALPSEKKLLDELAGELKGSSSIKTWVVPIDLAEERGAEKLYEQVKKDAGDIFALVCNAGTVAYGKFWELDWEAQWRIVQVNVIASMRLMHLFIADMVERDEGVVFVTSSVAAFQPTVFHTVYGATKAAIQSLAQGVRKELTGTSVRVCTLNPPYTDTPLLRVKGFPRKVRWYSLGGLKTPEWVARKAIGKFERGKFLYVPGFFSKFMHLFFIRLVPKRFTDFVSYYSLQSWKGTGAY